GCADQLLGLTTTRNKKHLQMWKETAQSHANANTATGMPQTTAIMGINQNIQYHTVLISFSMITKSFFAISYIKNQEKE
ncbi:MAG: hypothetical protein GY797_18615, partial [Deltaproteobacteria bacterium]|nr:hypothetical protein [Deltaproteobacteria bacterium]